MEEDLDEIASGLRPWQPTVRELYNPLSEALKTAEDAPADRAGDGRALPGVREAADPALRPLRAVLRLQRLPRVPLHAAGRRRRRPQPTDEKCDVCGSAMVVKRGRFGAFLACTKYPECKGTKPLLAEDRRPCPKDGGEIVERITRARAASSTAARTTRSATSRAGRRPMPRSARTAAA